MLIDCGKTFREVILNLFPKHGLREVGALLLTHGHADAILGMDDLRDLQIYEVRFGRLGNHHDGDFMSWRIDSSLSRSRTPI